ncbi:MAG: hypothetical protein LBP53_08300 [Candidatus Peribacteria bacterium]|jgi:hypothetical protein|nr:hypothetical protein [Candidatus Peribacteria bacterium]
MRRNKKGVDYGATPRRKALERFVRQTQQTVSELKNAMQQPGFIFGEISDNVKDINGLTDTDYDENGWAFKDGQWIGHPDESKRKYKEEVEGKNDIIEKRVQELSAQILAANNFEKIATDAITTTPCYMKEERLEDLVNAISNQKGNFISIIYFNGPRNRLDATFSEKEYKTQLAKLKNLAKKDKRIIVIDHLYNDEEGYSNKRTATKEKVIPMGTIRADMIDAIKKTIDYTKVADPKLIGIDADTYKMDENYIMGMKKQLDITSNKFLHSSVRRYDVAESKGDEWAFILERAWLSQITPWMHSEGSKTLTGATFGFKLSDYNRTGGFQRDPNKGKMYEGNFSGGEDSALEEAF